MTSMEEPLVKRLKLEPPHAGARAESPTPVDYEGHAHSRVEQGIAAVPTADEIYECLNDMSGHTKYKTVKFPAVTVMLRASTVPRRGNKGHLDFDIVQIETTPSRKGIGTQFVLNLIKASARMGRGVFLEQTITENSRAWAKRLVAQGVMEPYRLHGSEHIVEDNFLSVQ